MTVQSDRIHLQNNRNIFHCVVSSFYTSPFTGRISFSLIITCSMIIITCLLLVNCNNEGPETTVGTKISDNEIKGTWIKVSANSLKDTVIFTEERLEAPGASAVGGGYKVEDGRIVLADEVMAEYDIKNDTLYIEQLIATEPDGIIDYSSANKYVRSATQPQDTSKNTNSNMDSIGKDIPVGLSITYTDTLYTAGMALIKAKNDTFNMGIANSQYEKDHQHKACLTYNYYINIKEVTCGEYCKAINYAINQGYADIGYRKYIDDNIQVVLNKQGEEQSLLDIDDKNKLIGYSGSKSSGIVSLFNSRYPVVFVSWYGAAFYCNMLSEQRGLEPVYNVNDWSINYKANGYRLPTNTEHEYATRAGSDANYFWGNDWSTHDRYVADIAASGGMYQVASKLNNKFGLYDMVGNANEMCNDWFALNYYSNSPFYNPVGPELSFLTGENTTGTNVLVTNRVIRGGGGDGTALSGWHQGLYPGNMTDRNGFRVVLPVKENM